MSSEHHIKEYMIYAEGWQGNIDEFLPVGLYKPLDKLGYLSVVRG